MKTKIKDTYVADRLDDTGRLITCSNKTYLLNRLRFLFPYENIKIYRIGYKKPKECDYATRKSGTIIVSFD